MLMEWIDYLVIAATISMSSQALLEGSTSLHTGVKIIKKRFFEIFVLTLLAGVIVLFVSIPFLVGPSMVIILTAFGHLSYDYNTLIFSDKFQETLISFAFLIMAIGIVLEFFVISIMVLNNRGPLGSVIHCVRILKNNFKQSIKLIMFIGMPLFLVFCCVALYYDIYERALVSSTVNLLFILVTPFSALLVTSFMLEVSPKEKITGKVDRWEKPFASFIIISFFLFSGALTFLVYEGNKAESNLLYYDGQMELWQGNYSGALYYFEEAISKNSKNHEAWYLKGAALEELGRYDEAITAYGRAIEHNQSYRSSYAKAGLLSKLNRTDEAIEVYNEYIEAFPEDPEPFLNKGIILSETKRHEEALDTIERGIELNQSHGFLWFFKGLTLNAMGRCDEALIIFDNVEELMPNDLEIILIWKGECLKKLNQTEKLFKLSNEALGLYPDNGDFWLKKGDSLKDMKRYDESLQAYDKALLGNRTIIVTGRQTRTNISGLHEEAYTKKGLVFMEMENYSAAIESFDKALELDPDYKKAKEARESALEKMNN
jgi:tetratricopeptide (TPR) repeat protein